MPKGNTQSPGNVENFQNAPRCNAIKKDGTRCQGTAMKTNGRCRIHGGKTPHGMASPHYKGRDYSKRIPKGAGNLLESYVEVRNDQELLNLSGEAALIAARVSELVGKIDVGESLERWKKVREQWRIYSMAIRAKDSLAASDAKAELDKLLSITPQEWYVWDEIYKAIRELRGVTSQEQKRRMDMNALVSTEEAIGFISEVLAVVKKELEDDPKKMRRIYGKAQEVLLKHSTILAATNEEGAEDGPELGPSPAASGDPIEAPVRAIDREHLPAD